MTSGTTDTTVAAGGRPRFGFMRIVRDAWAMFMRAPTMWVLLAVPAAVLTGLRFWYQAQEQYDAALLFLLFGAVAAVLAIGMTTQLAWSRWAGAPFELGRAFHAARARVLALVGWCVIASLGIVIGMALLVVPGLYLAGALFVLWPIIVLEGKGLDGLERTLELTKDYRWPAVGLAVATLAGALVATIILGAVVGAAFGVMSADPAQSQALNQAVAQGLAQLVWIPIFGLVSVACYRRLKAIKAGRADKDEQDGDWPYTGAGDGSADRDAGFDA